MAFSPRLTPENFRAPFTSAEGWGTFTQKRGGGVQTARIDVRWGRLRLKTLALDLPAGVRPAGARPAGVRVTAAGAAREASSSMRENRITLHLGEPVAIEAGRSFEAAVSLD
jgi:hypothetical protein